MYQIRLSKLPLIEYKLKIINVVRVGYNRNILNCFFLWKHFYSDKNICVQTKFCLYKNLSDQSLFGLKIFIIIQTQLLILETAFNIIDITYPQETKYTGK